MFLSIIIPIYNAQEYLEDCLYSCLNQPFQINDDYEIICVNDGSTDLSLDILNRYEPKGVITIQQDNNGVSSARNHGLRCAKGDYVWFVDSDDCIHPSSLLLLKQAIDNSHITGYGFLRERVPASFDIHSVLTNNVFSNVKWQKQNELFEYVFTNVISRKYLLDNNCLFNENMPYHEDYLWAVNVMMHGAVFMKSQVSLYYYRNNPSSVMGVMHKNFKKWQKSRIVLIGELKKILDSGRLATNKKIQDLVINEVLWSVPHVMDGTARFLSYAECMELVEELKRMKVYPYPMRSKELFHICSLRDLKYKLSTFLFPLENYYRIYSRIIHISNKRSNKNE